ncbi:MAG: hypothetical protein R6X02_22790 [Enhygromyxa sp.]
MAINLRLLCKQQATALEDLAANKIVDLRLDVDGSNSVDKATLENWKNTCADYCGAQSPIDMCAFEDPTLARAAVAVATPDILAVLGELEPIRQTADKVTKEMTKRTALGQRLVDFNSSVGALRMEADAGVPGAALAGGVGMDVLTRLLGGLAKVIEDRAKREALGWMLDEVGEQLCGLKPHLSAAEQKQLETLENTKKLDADQKKQLETLEGRLTEERERLEQIAGTPNIDSYAELLAAARARAEENVKDDKGKTDKQKDKDRADKAFVDELAQKYLVHQELRTSWLPNICTLATGDRLDHYGAGAALLEAVRGALEADIRGWPGVVAGLVVAEAHWAIVETSADSPALVTCDSNPSGDSQELSCGEVERLRRAGERFVARLLDRSDPLDALRELGSAISRETIRTDQGDSQHSFTDKPLALLSCGLSLPAELAYFGPRFAIHSNPEYSALLAGLVRAPACWVLVGEGYSTIGEYKDKDAKDANGEDTKKRAIDDPRVERLSTLIRLHEQIGRPIYGILVEVAAVQRAIVALEAANRARTHASDKARVTAHWQAGLALIDASLSLADSVFLAAETVADPKQVLPGLAPSNIKELHGFIEKGRKVSADLREAIEIVAQIATGDFGQALALGSSELLDRLGGACKTDECRARVNLVVRSSGTIAALLSAENADQVAEVLDAAANPPGGWRRKLAKGNFTISLVAYPGAMGGAEFRWGPYGAHYEQGSAYAQYPALALPFGLDFVWGRGKWAHGLFASLIDPVAFLQYDASNDGRLPGPRPVTVLAPGLSWRVNLGPTPLIAIIGATFRPQFRTWEATVSGPGANVLQIGVALGVDVTMWKLFARGK